MPHMQQKPSAEETYPDVFEVSDLIIERLHFWIEKADLEDDGTFLGLVKIGILARAFNQYKAIINLLRTNHWEDALILTRSLFELLLNTEEINRHDNLEESAKKFCLFGELQAYRMWRELNQYQVLTGQAEPETEEKIKRYDKQAQILYAQFRRKKKKGLQWKNYWHDKNVYQLAKDSANPKRMDQYNLLYAEGSQFAHANAYAVYSSWQFSARSSNLDEVINNLDAIEENELRKIASFASIFIGEILTIFGDQLPDFDSNWVADTLGPLIRKIYPTPIVYY